MSDCDQFICFYDRGRNNNEDAEDRVPIGAGSSREEAIQDGLPASLAIGADGGFWQLMCGYITTVAQPDISPDKWKVVVDGIRKARREILGL